MNDSFYEEAPRKLVRDFRLYVTSSADLEAVTKANWTRESCYDKNPGEDFFHNLVGGEIYIRYGQEKLCLSCATRRGLISSKRPNLLEGADGLNDTFSLLRNKMPVTNRWAYLDHAAVAPLPEPTGAVIAEYATDFAENGCANWPFWRKKIENARKSASSILNANLSEIGIIRNTSEGISLIAEGFPWKPGDNVVVPADEFPSNLFPWMNLKDRGVELRLVQPKNGVIDPAHVDAMCDSKTRIVSSSWINFANGYRNSPGDLADVAHKHGALFFLDAIQGVGAFPLDVHDCGIDFLAADGHKWMLGPEGAGILFIANDHLETIRPTQVGWNSVIHSANFSDPKFDLKPTTGRFETGTYNMGGTAGLSESLKLLDNIGTESIGKQIRKIGDYLCDKLEPTSYTVVSDRSPDRASGIISVEPPYDVDPQEMQKRCFDAGIMMNNRAGRMRFSPHCYTSQGDIDRLIDVLAIDED